MKPIKCGTLIAIEGIDGSGKSTLAGKLYNQLTNESIPAVLTKEPGATKLGSQLRSILHEKPFDICPKSEYLLFAADRAEHIHSVVAPALNKNNVVISDRMGDSSIVYQGYARGLDITMIEAINRWAMNYIQPDLIFYIQLSAEQAMERIKCRNTTLTSFEKEGKPFIEKLTLGFNTIFKNQPNVIWLDGTKSSEELKEIIFKNLSSWLTKQYEKYEYTQ